MSKRRRRFLGERLGVGADSLWTPYAFGSSLVGYYEPKAESFWSLSDGTLAVPGGNVRTWRDSSGNSNHLDQSSGTNQPSRTAVGQFENLFAQSEEPTATWWILSGVTVTPEAGGFVLEDDGLTATNRLSKTSAEPWANLTTCTWSFEFKKNSGEGTELVIGHFDGGFVDRIHVNLTTGGLTVATGAPTATVVDLGGGWFQVNMQISPGANADMFLYPSGLTAKVVNLSIRKLHAYNGAIGTKSYIATGANPIWAGIGGYAGIKTDGVDDFFEKAFTLDQPCTIAAVVRPVTVSTTKQVWVAGAAADVAAIYTDTGSTSRAASAGTKVTGNALTTSPVVQIISLNGASSRLFMDGVWADASLGTNNPGGIAVGSAFDQSADANGIFTELITLNRQLAASEETLLANYLNNKYAIP